MSCRWRRHARAEQTLDALEVALLNLVAVPVALLHVAERRKGVIAVLAQRRCVLCGILLVDLAPVDEEVHHGGEGRRGGG